MQIVEAIGDEQRAFSTFLAKLGPRLDECEYHQVNWPAVIETAIAALGPSEEAPNEAAGDLATVAARIARARGMDDAELAWLEWLFTHAIQVVGNGRVLQNGQRRVCALTAAGIARCPVLVDA